jgi:hypothetical protein
MLTRLLALTLLLALPASAQEGDKGNAAPVNEAGEVAGKDHSKEKAAALRERADQMEKAGRTRAAESLRRRAERLEQGRHGKAAERRKKGQPAGKDQKPDGEKKKS